MLIVSQALTGQLTPPQPVFHQPPPAAFNPAAFNNELERQKEIRSGITMAVLGGSYLVYQVINFIFSAPFIGWRSPFGFGSFIAFIVCGVGISKIISSRLLAETASTTSGLINSTGATQSSMHRQAKLAAPRFSVATPIQQPAPSTNELDPTQPTISVTEDETKHLRR
ncbi:MAG: hypothetical protein AAB401_20230 [Acidobacteriota bacterium]